jgi:hypothetical protein
MAKLKLVQLPLSDEEIRTLVHYARRKFLEEGWPMSPTLRSVRAALGKVEPRPAPLPLISQAIGRRNLSEDRQRETKAARLRSSAATATTNALRVRLLQQAEKQEQFARGEPGIADEQKGRAAG